MKSTKQKPKRPRLSQEVTVKKKKSFNNEIKNGKRHAGKKFEEEQKTQIGLFGYGGKQRIKLGVGHGRFRVGHGFKYFFRFVFIIIFIIK